MEPRLRLDAFADLISSEGWKLLVVLATERYQRYQAKLQTTTGTETLSDVRYLQGAIDELKFLVELPNREVRAARAKIGSPAEPGEKEMVS